MYSFTRFNGKRTNKITSFKSQSLLLLVVQVGFASLALRVSSIETGTCEAKVTRMGLFGDIVVQWKAGYPSGQAPPGLRLGAVTPSSGKTHTEGTISEKLNYSTNTLSQTVCMISFK